MIISYVWFYRFNAKKNKNLISNEDDKDEICILWKK